MKRLLLLLLPFCMLSGCGADVTLDTGAQEAPFAPDAPSAIEELIEESKSPMMLAALPELTSAQYEGWIVLPKEEYSTGIFTDPKKNTLTIPESVDVTKAVEFKITIEPQDDTDPAASDTVVLSGKVAEGKADLAPVLDPITARGTYLLGTPTNGQNNQETSGVWFVTARTVRPSLELDTAPDGWSYEGWVTAGNHTLSTGRFKSPAGTDSSGIYNATDFAPPRLPGEDFFANAPEGVTFPLDLADGNSHTFITLEPDHNNTDVTGASPFSFIVLTADIPAGLKDHTDTKFDVALDTVPSGTVTLWESASEAKEPTEEATTTTTSDTTILP